MSITAPTFNSVSISGTTATLNIMPPVDAAYSICHIFYRKFGHDTYTLGSTYTGSQGVAGNATQSGLLADTLYQFIIFAADSSSRYSAPSVSRQAHGTTSVADNNLFVSNAITLLSNSTNFQTFTNQNTAELAQTRIHNKQLDYVVDELYFPCSCVYFETDNSIQIDTDNFLRTVPIKIQFLQEITKDRERNEAELSRIFMASVGKIVSDLYLLNGVDSYLNFKSLDMPNAPSFSAPFDSEDGPEALIQVTITLQAGF